MSLIDNISSAIQFYLSKDDAISYVATGAAITASGYLLGQILGGRGREPAGPPRVPYTIPLIGHSLELSNDPIKFLQECNAKYGEKFIIHALGEETLVMRGKLGYEVMRAEEGLSMEATVRDMLHLDKVLPMSVFDLSMQMNPKTIRAYYVPSKMHNYTDDIRIATNEALDDIFGYLPGPKELDNPHKVLQQIVAKLSARLFIGAEQAHNQEVIDSMALFTGDVMKAAAVLTIVPSFLRKTALKYSTNVPHHHQVMIKHVKPMIEERMRLKQKLGDAYVRKEGYVEWIMDWKMECPDVTAEQLGLFMLMQGFASVHTTSQTCAWALNWLVARPDVQEVLLREIDELLPNDDDVITHEIVLQMNHMDAFFREVLRHGVEMLGMRKVATRDFVFSDGTLLKKGKVVCVQELQLNFLKKNADGTEVYDDSFDPWRSMHLKTKNAMNGGIDHVIFGLGKHMCPGRYLAIYEMKILFTLLLKRYKFQTINGAAPAKPVDYLFGMSAIPTIQPLEILNRK